MQASLTYANVFDYLLRLGQRFYAIGRAELSLTGEALAAEGYPLLLVEADAAGAELVRPDGTPTGLDTFTVAVQVLTQHPRPAPADLLAMLDQTNTWADCLTEQLRQECSTRLVSVSKLPLPGTAGTDLACGWRLELTLKLAKDIRRTTNRDLFAPEESAV